MMKFVRGKARPMRRGAICSRRASRARLLKSLVSAVLLLAVGLATFGQGSRKDDIVFGPSGHPIAGATVRVCQTTATGTPCTPLATLYTDTTLTTTAPNPLLADGIGNYHYLRASRPIHDPNYRTWNHRNGDLPRRNSCTRRQLNEQR